MIATSWICFCCFTKKKRKEKKSGISTNPKAEKQPFSAGDKQTPIKASMTSKTNVAGARLERRDADTACNMSKGRGREGRR